MFESILFKVFQLPFVGDKIKMYAAKKQGGMQESSVIREYSKRYYKVDVGMYSYGGCFSSGFNNGGTVTIGRYCSFASHVHYFGANHPMNYISMSPYFYNKSFNKDAKDIVRNHLEIGNDCWIGFGSIITCGCKKIGNGAVIAAGAVVTKDVPAYAVVAGIPASVLKYKFDEETIEMIEKSKWWEKTPQECLKFYDQIASPLEFCRSIMRDE